VLKLQKIIKSKCLEKINIKMYAIEIYQNTKLFRVIPVKWIIDFGHKNIVETKSIIFILIYYKSFELKLKFEKLREKTHYITNFHNDEDRLYKIFIKEVGEYWTKWKNQIKFTILYMQCIFSETPIKKSNGGLNGRVISKQDNNPEVLSLIFG
jgi:hypothetical protein